MDPNSLMNSKTIIYLQYTLIYLNNQIPHMIFIRIQKFVTEKRVYWTFMSGNLNKFYICKIKYRLL